MKPISEFLEREGGHVFILFILLILCALVVICFPANHDAIAIAKDGCKTFGGMFAYAMKGLVIPRAPQSETK